MTVLGPTLLSQLHVVLYTCVPALKALSPTDVLSQVFEEIRNLALGVAVRGIDWQVRDRSLDQDACLQQCKRSEQLREGSARV